MSADHDCARHCGTGASACWPCSAGSYSEASGANYLLCRTQVHDLYIYMYMYDKALSLGMRAWLGKIVANERKR
jgi:hypothetical protein